MTVTDDLADLLDLLRHVPVTEAAKLAVVERLREPHRHYHTLEHVLEMWRWHTEHNQGKFDDASAAAKQTAQVNCGGCHMAHREKAADGSFKIK